MTRLEKVRWNAASFGLGLSILVLYLSPFAFGIGGFVAIDLIGDEIGHFWSALLILDVGYLTVLLARRLSWPLAVRLRAIREPIEKRLRDVLGAEVLAEMTARFGPIKRK